MSEHIKGPWQWQINVKCKQVALVSVSGGHWVMGFARYGMGGAAPEFIGEDGLLSRAECFAKPVAGREHHSHWFQTLDNPNAKLIAAAPELLEACRALLEAIRAHELRTALPLSGGPLKCGYDMTMAAVLKATA